MTDFPPDRSPAGRAKHSRVEIIDEGRTIADADVSTPAEPDGTATVAFHAEHGRLPPDTRSNLVDAVMEHPEIVVSDHLHAVIPMGDSESITRLREHTSNLSARPAGSSSVIDAELLPDDNER